MYLLLGSKAQVNIGLSHSYTFPTLSLTSNSFQAPIHLFGNTKFLNLLTVGRVKGGMKEEKAVLKVIQE